MNRLITSPIALSDGTILPTGARVIVATNYADPNIYTNPDTFDPYRFLREREKPDQNNTWQHVTVSPSHMAFGYGQHACPGRFFVSNELKIALSHLLLKYDWKNVEGKGRESQLWEFETNTMAKPGCKVQLKRRREEIDLDLVELLE